MKVRSGYTLVEIMLVVSIIGILAVLAIPAIRKARARAQNGAFMNDLRALSGSFEQHAIENGNFPANAAPGVVPAGMTECLPKRFDWTAPTPIGGQWDWDRADTPGNKIHGVYAGISVYLPARTTVQMQEIDKAMDNGDLLTGRFRSRTDGYIFVIEE